MGASSDTILYFTTTDSIQKDSEVQRKKALKAARDRRYYNRGGKYKRLKTRLHQRIATKQIRIEELERLLYE